MKRNKYTFVDDYVVGYTKRGYEFYFDKNDYDIVSQYYWLKKSNGVIVRKDKFGKEFSMHHLIMGEGIYVHKNGNKADNRKENLIYRGKYKNDGFVDLNGYNSVYMPNHPRSFDNGCVYEHVLVAESIVKRNLYSNECVHHIDGNRKNNSMENLMIFATSSDHILFHNGADVVLQEDGAYISVKNEEVYYASSVLDEQKEKNSSNNKTYKYSICPICNTNLKSFRAEMCLKCHKKKKERSIPTKEELEKHLLTESFTEIGRCYSVSDNAVRKWCLKYKLPKKVTDLKKWRNEKGREECLF